MTRKEIANEIGISTKTLYRWIKEDPTLTKKLERFRGRIPIGISREIIEKFI
ncbi:MAG: hypothetical protein MJZ30_09525 [Paludibacteraceae bacterium]|nr:hypothetical protein [Paludibacteraceae bacterium]